jgi:hypothetical protein
MERVRVPQDPDIPHGLSPPSTTVIYSCPLSKRRQVFLVLADAWSGSNEKLLRPDTVCLLPGRKETDNCFLHRHIAVRRIRVLAVLCLTARRTKRSTLLPFLAKAVSFVLSRFQTDRQYEARSTSLLTLQDNLEQTIYK